jgi:hypothetical protein
MDVYLYLLFDKVKVFSELDFHFSLKLIFSGVGIEDIVVDKNHLVKKRPLHLT